MSLLAAGLSPMIRESGPYFLMRPKWWLFRLGAARVVRQETLRHV